MSEREEWTQRIRESSRREVILSEMRRLGFWSDDAPHAVRLEELSKERRALYARLRALQRELSELDDLDALRAHAHKARLAAARARRAETRARREAARAAAREAREARRAREIAHLGPVPGADLGDLRPGRPERLRALGLPVLPDMPALADALDTTVPELRWLAYDREVSQTTHYVHFTVPKKTGGVRLISAPMPRLKRVQRTVADWLNAVPLHDAAHGFVPGRSIVSNAAAHVGRETVVNMDLRDFFPSIGWVRVRGIFEQLGHPRPIATVLALLCTAAPVEELSLDGRRWWVQTGPRVLPQGSPASPVLTNLLCRRLDARLAGLAASKGFDYTRYADDLTFSTRPGAEHRLGSLLKGVEMVVVDEGLVVHPDKTRVMHRGRRQEVTGLVVNDRVGVPREQLRRYRAVLHQLRTTGPAGLHWGAAPTVFAGLHGFAAFVHMVEPARGAAMLTELRALAEVHGWALPRPPPPKSAPVDSAAADDPAAAEDPATTASLWDHLIGGEKKWWQFWR